MLCVSVIPRQPIKHKPGSANGALFMFYLLKSTKILIYQCNLHFEQHIGTFKAIKASVVDVV